MPLTWLVLTFVYRDDLKRVSDNGRSLLGLADSLREQKKHDQEIAATTAKFDKQANWD
ncbi:MAG: hypothetical protein H0T95_03775 [Chthoniobacterales bacterium]|nr:hypothetical protein [Chthoniobacterales bacterium]